MNYLSLDSDLSYIYGWFAGDGGIYNTTRNRGKLSTEINIIDIEILEKMKTHFEKIGVSSILRTRTRDTNFKSNYSSVSLTIYSLEVRKFFMSIGFPEGSKSLTMKPPLIDFDKKSFARGFIDANGSFCIGKTNNIPIVSICLTSDDMYNFFIQLISDICGYKSKLTRNKRDNVYNLQITRKNAILFIEWLGYTNEEEISLKRKKDKALELIEIYKKMYE